MKSKHLKKTEKTYKIVLNGCPRCGADLEVGPVSVMCVNWQHPHHQDSYRKGGLRNCDYAILCG